MNAYSDNEIVAIDYNENEIRIAYKKVKNLQEYFGLHTIDIGGMAIAGSKKEYIKIETFDGESFEIPRAPGNDTEILNFLLRSERP